MDFKTVEISKKMCPYSEKIISCINDDCMAFDDDIGCLFRASQVASVVSSGLVKVVTVDEKNSETN